MLLKCFTIYDSKTECYLPPFFQRSTGEAVRIFQDLSVDMDTSIGRHPADYTLFEIGAFDDQTAKFGFKTAFVNLGVAIEHVAPREPTVGFERGMKLKEVSDG